MDNRPYAYEKSSSGPPVTKGIPHDGATPCESVVNVRQAPNQVKAPFNFLGLPAEIRNYIYEIHMRDDVDFHTPCDVKVKPEHAEVEQGDIEVSREDAEVEPENSRDKPDMFDCALDAVRFLVLTDVSRQVCAETMPWFVTDKRWRLQRLPLGKVQRPDKNRAQLDILDQNGQVLKWHFDDIQLFIHLDVHPGRKTPLMDVKANDPEPGQPEKLIPHTRETLCEDHIHDMLTNVYYLVETMFKENDFQGLRLPQLDQIADALIIKAVASRTVMPAYLKAYLKGEW